MEQEIWKDIIGFESKYQISNLGRVKSLYDKNGHNISKREKILKSINKKGYRSVGLNKNGKKYSYSVHRLIAIHFISNPENKPVINHKNGIKDDNRIENLEWCTISENTLHGYRVLGIRYNSHNKGKLGKLNKKSIKVNQYDLEGNFIKTWNSMSDVQRELGIYSGSVCACCKGKIKQSQGQVFKYF